MIPIIIFALILLTTTTVAFIAYSRLIRNIRLGKPTQTQPEDGGQRIKNTLLIALGQKKMFARPLSATMHAFIYVAFLVTQIELLEIMVDGLTGSHRFFAKPLGMLYTLVISSIELLSVLAFVATIVFLARRNILKLARFGSKEMKGWATRDANIILIAEIMLITFILLMNSADMAAKDGSYGFWISGLFYTVWGDTSEETLHLMSAIGWWGHIIMVFAYLNYLPYSKHLHIMLAFPNTYFASLNPRGEVQNMPEIQKEVESMFDPNAANLPPADMDAMPQFGVKDVFDLERKDLLAAYTCTECGRCTSSCPANITGKALSPRKIMMDIRDRADEIGKNIDANKTEFIREDQKTVTSKLTKDNYDDGKNLFSYITEEEIRACTTCNACVEACPVLISPLSIIMELRRNLILEQSKSPEAWNSMFNALDNNGAVWAFPREDREKWITEALNNN
jgi:heterodisulfide reductase subunit C